MAKHLAELHLRRTKMNELWGTFTTDTEMFAAVNAHMESLGFPAVGRQTLYGDKKVIGQERAQVFAEYRETLTAEHYEELSLLKRYQMEDYLRVRAADGNAAPYSDAVRKTLLTLGQMDGSVKQTTEHTGNVTFEMGVREVLAVNPEGERKVIPLLKDEGHGELLPPTKADG